jgi:parallel beta-helix repeat protein
MRRGRDPRQAAPEPTRWWRSRTVAAAGLVAVLVGGLVVSVRVLGRQDAPERPAGATEAPSTPAIAPTCAAKGGVPIRPGDNAQRVVEAHGAGTTYLVKAGTHRGTFSVEPKQGDSFCGERGAVLDGGRKLEAAFSGDAAKVTIDSITLQHYNGGEQSGAIHPDQHASGWVVRNVSARNNYWAGLFAADGMKILGGHYNDNEQLGISGNAATGIVLDGLDDDPATLDGPEMARNHKRHADCGYESGGMKWDQGHVTVRSAHVHDNDCRGLWADGNGKGLIEHNLVEGNGEEGIYIEISQDAVIRNNRVYRNGLTSLTSDHRWYWNGGITLAGSFNVQVHDNQLSGNYNGITGIQQDRPDSVPPAGLLNKIEVRDNLICAIRGEHATGVVADNGADLATRDITFARNTVRSATCEE